MEAMWLKYNCILSKHSIKMHIATIIIYMGENLGHQFRLEELRWHWLGCGATKQNVVSLARATN